MWFRYGWNLRPRRMYLLLPMPHIPEWAAALYAHSDVATLWYSGVKSEAEVIGSRLIGLASPPMHGQCAYLTQRDSPSTFVVYVRRLTDSSASRWHHTK